jgi:hypothetical protein
MAALQLRGEALQDLPLALALDRGCHLGGELFPFDAGHGQELLQLGLQATDPLLDGALDPGRQRLPIQRRALEPAAILTV